MDKKVIAVEVQAKETEDSIDKEEEGETDFSEDIMNMNLFEKIAVYQRKGLDHTVEYFQFLEIKKLTYFFWKLRYFIMSCAILLAGYLAVTAFMANMKLFAVFICVYLLGAPLGFVRKVNNEIERLLAIKDSEKMADDVSSIFIREHKTTYKTCWILIGISFLLVLFQILVRGVDIPNALFFFGLVQLSICTIWTFKRTGGAVLIILLLIISMFSKMHDEARCPI